MNGSKTTFHGKYSKALFSLSKRKRKCVLMSVAVFLYLGFISVTILHRALSHQPNPIVDKKHIIRDLRREKRDASLLEEEDENETCLPRSVEQFPGNFLSFEDTQDGGFVIHILLVLYIFGALAIICDDYFVKCLEIICDELKLKEDVAGATFMAAGSSAPEFFTSVIGVFIAESDVGVGTIVGSAVFNILFIIGICAIFAGMVVKLTWYPMMRDTFCYLLSVLALVVVIYDGVVHWYEGLILFIMYLLYILIMYFNEKIESRTETFVDRLIGKCNNGHLSYDDDEEKNNKQGLLDKRPTPTETSQETTRDVMEIETSFTGSKASITASQIVEEAVYESPWVIPDAFLLRMFWVLMLPVKALFFISVPDCRKPGKWRKTFPLTFVMSVVWIIGLSYVMVWMVAIIGDALDIPDTVMGLTLLAAGTSVPDCLSSLFVARDGLGDMAISNSIGSNVFDILMCLGIPWLIKTTAVDSDEPLQIASEGLVYAALTLLSTVVFIIAAVFIAKFRLGKKFGVLCLVVYVLVISLSCLYELNVFGDFNLKSCPRE